MAAASGADAWLELAVEADQEAVEAVAEILGRVATGGTSVEPAFRLVEEGLAAEVDPGRPAIVRGYIPARDEGAVQAAIQTVERSLGHLRAFELRPIGPLTTRLTHEADWADAWKAHFPVMRVGRRLVIKPTWRNHVAAPGDVVLALDPGMAFGTGLHPTTRLCLALLEDVAGDTAPRRVLDVGCGSGILSIAALQLGAEHALGLDTDAIAIESSAANAGRNDLSGRLDARLGSLPSGEPPFDLVLANLIASLLVRLAGDLAAEVRPGGTLVASGIFIDRETEVRTALTDAGFTLSDRGVEGDWVALAATRSVPDASAGPSQVPD